MQDKKLYARAYRLIIQTFILFVFTKCRTKFKRVFLNRKISLAPDHTESMVKSSVEPFRLKAEPLQIQTMGSFATKGCFWGKGVVWGCIPAGSPDSF